MAAQVLDTIKSKKRALDETAKNARKLIAECEEEEREAVIKAFLEKGKPAMKYVVYVAFVSEQPGTNIIGGRHAFATVALSSDYLKIHGKVGDYAAREIISEDELIAYAKSDLLHM